MEYDPDRKPDRLQKACCSCHSCVMQDEKNNFVPQDKMYSSHEVRFPRQVQRRLAGSGNWTTVTEDVPVSCACAVAKFQT